MANHTLDCEFCGEDQRLNSRCCQKSRDKQDRANETEFQLEKRLNRYHYLFHLYGLPSQVELLDFFYENLEKMPKTQYIVNILERVSKIEERERKEGNCSHKFKDGTSAWINKGGFIYDDIECQICGKLEAT